jgi:hypothetical protein
MSTAQTVAWEKETVESEVWATTIDCPPSWGKIPAENLNKKLLEAEIAQAKLLMGLGDNWDGEGSPGYSEATLDRAVAFVNAHTERLWDMYLVQPPIPSIGPGPEGSIDIHWKQPTWELLVNIPADVDKMASFYGDNYRTQKIKGSLDPEYFNLGIAEWLAN